MTSLRSGAIAVLLALTLPLASPAHGSPAQSPQVRADTAGQIASAAASYRTPSGAIFSRPGNGNIEKRIINNIRNMPRGAYVRAVSWSFSSDAIANALLAARRDGAVVRVLISRRDRNSAAVNKLQSALGSNCSPGRSCIKVVNYSARGSDRFDGALTTIHQKSWTFSTTGSSKDVTLITSHNATTGARDYQFNDGYQFVGNAAVYEAMVKKWNEQARDSAQANPWDVVQISNTVALYFGPWNSPGMADPVVRRIQNLSNTNLVIRVANSAWTGDRGAAIARALAAKARNGAKVFVLASRPLGAGVRSILEGARIPIRNGYFGERNYHHLKFMTAKWGTAGSIKTRVWSGSENWSENSRGSDELVVRVGAGQTHGDFVSFFDSIYNR